jgi:parvulin-like peptidyl-prolyl isomerase
VKSYSIIKNIKLTLLALIGTLLLGAEATGTETAKRDGATQDVPVSTPVAQGSRDKKANTAGPVAPGSSANNIEASLPIFAKVGKMSITWVDYNNEYADQSRKKFYHGKPTEDAVAAFQREIADTLITNAMLVQEAKRRKLKPDAAFVKQQLDNYERRFAKDPNWPKARARVLPILTERAKNESLRNQVEPLVRKVRPPSVKQLREYYAAHLEKFTAPPQQRVSIILLRMDPSAPNADWQKALEQGQDLVKRLRAGEDFAKLAREYSGDITAENGGDMGYLHEGMLPGMPSMVLSKLQPGETSDPVTLMEGVAIFRLTERKPASINSFEKAKQSVRELWLAEKSDNAWNSLIAKLKKNTPVQMDESHFLPLPATPIKPAESPEPTKP